MKCLFDREVKSLLLTPGHQWILDWGRWSRTSPWRGEEAWAQGEVREMAQQADFTVWPSETPVW